MSKLQAVYDRMQKWISELLRDHEEYNEFLDPFLSVRNVQVFLCGFRKQEEVQPLIQAMKAVDDCFSEEEQIAEANKLICTLYEKHNIDPSNFEKEHARMRKYLMLFAHEV